MGKVKNFEEMYGRDMYEVKFGEYVMKFENGKFKFGKEGEEFVEMKEEDVMKIIKEKCSNDVVESILKGVNLVKEWIREWKEYEEKNRKYIEKKLKDIKDYENINLNIYEDVDYEGGRIIIGEFYNDGINIGLYLYDVENKSFGIYIGDEELFYKEFKEGEEIYNIYRNDLFVWEEDLESYSWELEEKLDEIGVDEDVFWKGYKKFKEYVNKNYK